MTRPSEYPKGIRSRFWRGKVQLSQSLFQNPREPRRGEKRAVQGGRRRRAVKRAVDDERRRNAKLLAPPPRGCGGEGPSAASDLLDDPLRGRLRRSSLHPTPRRRNRGHGGFA